MKTVREILIANAGDEAGYDDSELTEVLFDSKIVHTGLTDSHRWYSSTPVVAKVGDHFISFFKISPDGDGYWADCTSSKEILDDARVVERKERVITETYYE